MADDTGAPEKGTLDGRPGGHDEPAGEGAGASGGLGSTAPDGIRVAVYSQHSALHVGPLPPPEQIAAYEEVCPGAADRILAMAEREQQHRHQCERDRLSADVELAQQEFRDRRLGKHYGIVVSAASLAAAVGCAALGATVAAGIIGGSTVVGLVTVFVVGIRSRASGGDADRGDPPASV